MSEDEMIRRLVTTKRVTKGNCTAFFAAAAECGLEVVPRRDGPLAVGRAPSPVHPRGKVTIAPVAKRRIEVAPPRGAVELRQKVTP